MSSLARSAIRLPSRAAVLPRTSSHAARTLVTRAAIRLSPSSSSVSVSVIPTSARARQLQQTWVRYKTTGQKGWGPPIVSYEELKPITEQPTDDIVLIDVREPDEVALGSIPSAVNLPLSQLSTHLSSSFHPGEFRSAHGFDKPLPSQKIVFFCRSGKRSANAAELAGREGYGNVRNYEGSWLDWVKREKEGPGAGGAGGSKWDDDD